MTLTCEVKFDLRDKARPNDGAKKKMRVRQL